MFGFSNDEVSWYKKDGKIGLKKGFKKITSPVYDKLKMPFDSESGTTQAYIDGKWGLINEKGEVLIPFSFSSIGEFKNGMAFVENQGVYGLYTISGRCILDCIYEMISVDPLDNFTVKKDNKYGVLGLRDGEMKTIIQPEYDHIMSDGTILFIVTKGDKQGIFDNQGIEVLPLNFTEILELGRQNDGVKLFRFTENAKHGIVTTLGDVIIPPCFDYIEKFHNKISRISLDGKWGFIGIRGEMLVEPTYDELHQFNSSGEAHCIFNGRSGKLQRDAVFNSRMPHQKKPER